MVGYLVWSETMPISSRFVVNFTIISLAVGLLSLLAIIGTTVWLGERAQAYFNDALRLRDTRTAAVELRSAVQNAESSQRGFLLSGNEIYLAPFDTAKAEAQTRLRSLKELLATAKTAEPLVQRLSEVITQKFEEMDRTIALKSDFHEADALAIFRTNRGKALMDEANLFLSSTVRGMDERLTQDVAEQRTNANWLRWVSTIGGFVIILVVGGVTVTLLIYSREISQTRDQVQVLNATLEQRVKDRTSDLARARDKAEVLLAEVNHRVANSLSMVASMVRLQANAAKDKASKDSLSEVQTRIYAISAVHQRLYSSGDTNFVDLSEYLSGLLANVETAMRDEGRAASLSYNLEPLRMKTDASVNLGMIVAEWVTNAYKYAYPDRSGEIRVSLKQLPSGRAELVVEDDGVGRGDGAVIRGTGLGTRIVTAMAHTIGADVDYLPRNPGTAARLAFPWQPA
jgi:two-component sensor histidine kinase/CHASE3 domain sensor protein